MTASSMGSSSGVTRSIKPFFTTMSDGPALQLGLMTVPAEIHTSATPVKDIGPVRATMLRREG